MTDKAKADHIPDVRKKVQAEDEAAPLLERLKATADDIKALSEHMLKGGADLKAHEFSNFYNDILEAIVFIQQSGRASKGEWVPIAEFTDDLKVENKYFYVYGWDSYAKADEGDLSTRVVTFGKWQGYMGRIYGPHCITHFTITHFMAVNLPQPPQEG